MSKEESTPYSFKGDNAKLVDSIKSLLALDSQGALVPHGVGGMARQLLESAAERLTAAEQRNSDLEKVLSPFANYAANAGWLPPFSVRCSKGLFAVTSDDWQAVATLNPEESGASE